MSDSKPSILERLSGVVASLRRLIGRSAPAEAAEIEAEAPRPKAKRSPRKAAQPMPPPAATEPQSALQLLSLLQQNGRFIDFLQQDITAFSDQEVGAAARLVHQGCRQVLEEYLAIRPIRDEPEGSQVTLGAGFDASMVRVTGNVVGEAPFTGTLIHRGWRATQVSLPQVAAGHDLKIVTTAEVEL